MHYGIYENNNIITITSYNLLNQLFNNSAIIFNCINYCLYGFNSLTTQKIEFVFAPIIYHTFCLFTEYALLLKYKFTINIYLSLMAGIYWGKFYSGWNSIWTLDKIEIYYLIILITINCFFHYFIYLKKLNIYVYMLSIGFLIKYSNHKHSIITNVIINNNFLLYLYIIINVNNYFNKYHVYNINLFNFLYNLIIIFLYNYFLFFNFFIINSHVYIYLLYILDYLNIKYYIVLIYLKLIIIRKIWIKLNTNSYLNYF